MTSGSNPSNQPVGEALTRREREILALLAEGLTGPEIAMRLTVATSSVKSHIQHLYSKLGVNNKREAVVRARALGLLNASSLAAAPVVPAASPGLRRPPHNLPQELTRLFGREAEAAQLGKRVAEHRLVTLTGAGGVGKTRLALRVAEVLLDRFSDGVWLVELAALSDPALVPQQVAVSLGLRSESSQPGMETLTGFLRERQVLLVLDNCEHLLAACAQLAHTLLRVCPPLCILATSREPLAVPGEALFQVPSLPFPNQHQVLSAHDLGAYAAISLFADRACLIQPEYHVAEHNAAAVARICQRLDGIPLAIEMAAARVNIMSAAQLGDRLDDAFNVLSANDRTVLPRQQTLRATLDWSYQLLTPPERRLLQRLSVFAGGWTLEAAEAVCADAIEAGGRARDKETLQSASVWLPSSDVLGLLGSLVAKSLVRANRRTGAETRYDLLELVRQFAREKLDEANDFEHLRRRHLAYFLALATSAFLAIPTPHQQRWANRLKHDRDNLRMALETSFTDPVEVAAGPTLVRLLIPLWPLAPPEGRSWCQRAVARCLGNPGLPGHVHARLLVYQARFTMDWDNLPQGVAEMKAAVEFTRGLHLPNKSPLLWGAPEGPAILMFNLHELAVFVASEEKVKEALALIAEAEAIFHDLGPEAFPPEVARWIRAGFAGQQARLANKQGRYAEAKVHAAIMLGLMKENGDSNGAMGGYHEIGHACLELGEYQQASEHFRAAEQIALDIAREQAATGVAYAEMALVYTWRCLGLVALHLGDLETAEAYCHRSLREALKGPSPRYLPRGYGGSTLALAAAIAAKRGQVFRAASLAGSAHALYADAGRQPWEDTSLDVLLPGWHDSPAGGAILEAYEAGRVMPGDEVIRKAFSPADADNSNRHIS